MLIQLVYCSGASQVFSAEDLKDLLQVSRRNNQARSVSGMLLYSDGSFMQVLEGEEEDVDAIYGKIEGDLRHHGVTTIIRSPILERSFAEWTMGFTSLTADELEDLFGGQEGMVAGNALAQLGATRAERVLRAFREGRWRSRLEGAGQTSGETVATPAQRFPAASGPRPVRRGYSYSYQPIVDAAAGLIVGYEGLIRGEHDEPAFEVLQKVTPEGMTAFDEESRVHAIGLASYLGLSVDLSLNVMPSTILNSPTAVSSVLDAIADAGLANEQVFLEVVESDRIEDPAELARALAEYRGTGLQFAIDDFGAGYAGLSLLAEFQPDVLKVDRALIRHINERGPRQAILRGALHTCADLAIDVVAEGVETVEEFKWLRDEGVSLFQGYLFARPAFEELATEVPIPA